MNMNNPLFQSPIVGFQYKPLLRKTIGEDGDVADMEVYLITTTLSSGYECDTQAMRYDGKYEPHGRTPTSHLSKKNLKRFEDYVNSLPPVVDCENTELNLKGFRTQME